ncbi:hypothetical protein JYU29_04945 [Tianweitania sp. BSSL-BM11]|uniref:Uncharacterized protein n=1 Tax=Tianweitania aestuarii TaxID=2814886 RepID=A0ABS5RSS3_9HYPH|nr:hypothetical protein [Tianweitania aestuarii]MBS9720034.1 hypothetical protein [Tianweitania aestuarii]
MKRIRLGGPLGTVRPFVPTPELGANLETGEKIAEALEHIARSLSAIDHNLEVLVKNQTKK